MSPEEMFGFKKINSHPLEVVSLNMLNAKKIDRCYYYSAKRSDVTGNCFEWKLGENKVI